MKTKVCKNCMYYLQHYGLLKGKLYRVYCGHCTYIKAIRKYPDKQACDNFLPGISIEDSFVTKEFLSKELLQYVLKMDLLPEIPERRPELKNTKEIESDCVLGEK